MMRWLKFNAVGAMGMAVQITTLAVGVHLLELHYILATVLAVEAALLHNFVWHVTWTWPAHTGLHRRPLRSLLYFQLISGTVSIAGNTGFMWILVATAQLEPVLANLICIGACSLVNFAACSRFVFSLPVASSAFTRHGNARTGFDTGGIAMPRFRMGSKHLCICLCASAIVGPLTPLQAQGLRGETIQAWNEYVLLTENRIGEELYSDDGFLVQEFQAPAEARADREVVLSGQILVREMNTMTPGGKDIKVPGGMIHHWRGVVFIPGVTLDGVLAVVQNPDAEDHAQEDVLESRVLTRDGDSLRIFLKLVRSKIITVTYNTEHLVRYRRHAAGQVSSRTIATRIAELADAGTPDEREKRPGRDRGFLWRLNSYWRYQEVEGGVLVECESLTLSRSIPALISLFVRPMVEGVAKESMNRTLRSMRERFSDAGSRDFQFRDEL